MFPEMNRIESPGGAMQDRDPLAHLTAKDYLASKQEVAAQRDVIVDAYTRRADVLESRIGAERMRQRELMASKREARRSRVGARAAVARAGGGEEEEEGERVLAQRLGWSWYRWRLKEMMTGMVMMEKSCRRRSRFRPRQDRSFLWENLRLTKQTLGSERV